jgi:hypothetical protein
VALGRILGGRDALKYYEAGMDLGLARDVEESFRIFQGRILDEYEGDGARDGVPVIDATLSIEEQQRRMRDIVMNVLGEESEERHLASFRKEEMYAQADNRSSSIANRSGRGRIGTAGQADCDRRSGRGGAQHADHAAAPVAGARRTRGAGHGHGALGAGGQGHPGWPRKATRWGRSP